jgi:hypothetical protein
MENIVMTRKSNLLTLTVDLSKTLGKSSSGKSDLIASTKGNAPIPDQPEVRVGLNVYRMK